MGKKNKQELGGNIILENFDLDSSEMVIARKMTGKYGEKIRNFTDYTELRLEMKSHKKTKQKTFEIKGLLLFDGDRAVSESQGFNPFVLINEVLKNADRLVLKLTGFFNEVKNQENNLGKIMYDKELVQDLSKTLKEMKELSEIINKQLKENGLKVDADVF